MSIQEDCQNKEIVGAFGDNLVYQGGATKPLHDDYTYREKKKVKTQLRFCSNTSTLFLLKLKNIVMISLIIEKTFIQNFI